MWHPAETIVGQQTTDVNMPPIERSEIRPGLVVHLDTNVLRREGGSESNAEIASGADRAVQGPHYFLVVTVDAAGQRALAVPLFSSMAKGNELLDPAKKAGTETFWQNGTSYFSHWQHWWIPLAAMEAASSEEFTSLGARCTYADGDTAELQRIADWAQKNRARFRAV